MSRFRPCIFLAVLLCGGILPAWAQVGWDVSFNDPDGIYSAYEGEIQSDVLAAGDAWSPYLQGNGSVNLLINFDPTFPTAEGASTSTAYIGYDSVAGVAVFEQGAAYKALTGLSPQGNLYDGAITLGTGYLEQDLWFDPNPLTRTAPLPSDRVDAVSVFEHEIGHILAFNGFRDGDTGALTTPYESTFDQNVIASGGGLYFVGPDAEALYGGAVPLEVGDYGHLDGAVFPDDLMNGESLQFGQRYTISPLDLAVAADSGVAMRSTAVAGPAAPKGSTAVPEAGQTVLIACGLSLMLAVPARRRRRLR